MAAGGCCWSHHYICKIRCSLVLTCVLRCLKCASRSRALGHLYCLDDTTIGVSRGVARLHLAYVDRTGASRKLWVGAGAAGARLPALAGEVTILRDAAQVGGSSFMCVRNPNGIGKPRLTVWRADSVSSIGNSGSDCGSDCVPSLALLSIQSRTGCTEDRK